jgi:hypothetical protein
MHLVPTVGLQSKGTVYGLNSLRPSGAAGRFPPFKSSTPTRRALASAAFFRGPLSYASLSAKKYGTPYFQLESELIPEAAPSSPSFSVSEKLARYGSTALSGVEQLTLLVGKEAIAHALIRHFGSLTALSRASFHELRQFLPLRKAEAVV